MVLLQRFPTYLRKGVGFAERHGDFVPCILCSAIGNVTGGYLSTLDDGAIRNAHRARWTRRSESGGGRILILAMARCAPHGDVVLASLGSACGIMLPPAWASRLTRPREAGVVSGVMNTSGQSVDFCARAVWT